MAAFETFWSILPERSVQEYAFMASCAVASRAGNLGYTYITSNFMRTDVARNKLCAAFRKLSHDNPKGSPNDVLVMLDCDHTHPHDVIERLVVRPPELGVIGALAFRRGEPFFPCFFVRNPATGGLGQPLDIPAEGLLPCAIVGTGAIAIRRWVLDRIADATGLPPFLYEYNDTMHATGDYQSEDIYFGLTCEKLGISHYVDVGLVTPHLIAAGIDRSAWEREAEYLKTYYAQQQPAGVEE